MKYPVVIHFEDGSAYGVTVPDIAGCFSAGETIDEAISNAHEAITSHLSILAEDGEIAPPASDISVLRNNPDFADGVWAIVDIDVTPYLGKTEKVNVTLPAFLIKKIDEAVQAGKGKNRSSFLANSAMQWLSHA